MGRVNNRVKVSVEVEIGIVKQANHVVAANTRKSGNKGKPGTHSSKSTALPNNDNGQVTLTTIIHAEEKDGWSVVMMVLEGIVQLLVAVVRRAPNSMFDRRPRVKE